MYCVGQFNNPLQEQEDNYALMQFLCLLYIYIYISIYIYIYIYLSIYIYIYIYIYIFVIELWSDFLLIFRKQSPNSSIISFGLVYFLIWSLDCFFENRER